MSTSTTPDVREQRSVKRAIASMLAVASACTLALCVIPATAQADTAPAVANDPLNPPTVSAQGLPTVQIDGVVWTQEVVGNTVYVGGSFTTARPAGSAPGQNTVPRSNLLAYDIRTGNLITAWAPTTNGQVYDITASPDGTRIYVAGQFTNVNGQIKNRIAALNPSTGAIIQSFQVSTDASVRAVAATNTTVYFGGLFTSVNSVTRSRAAAVNASDGSLLGWAPVFDNTVRAIALSPDATKVFVGGHFLTTNGSNNPGRGLAFLDATTAALLPLAANASVIRNGGPDGAITTVQVDQDSVYVGGYTFGRSAGTLEGVARIGFDGNLIWVEDCHGDTYSISVTSALVYSAGHTHYCGNIPRGFQQNGGSADWRFFHSMAWSKQTATTLRSEIFDYTNFAGQPAPNMLHWFPQYDVGAFTGQDQAAWSIVASGDYVIAGGEFPSAGGLQQQGLVRFARVGVNGTTGDAPEFAGSRTVPKVTSPAPNTTLVTWETNWDRDNEAITYRVMRNGNTTTPAYEITVPSKEWNRPYLSWVDTNPTQGLVAGQSIRYRIFAVDANGNESRSDTVNLVGELATANTLDDYAKSVLADGPMHYWRLNEPAGSTTAADYTGLDPLTLTGTPTRDVPGALASDAATNFPGLNTTTGHTQTARYPSLEYVTVEAWFRGGSTMAGKIIGYGNLQTGNSGNNTKDRAIYIGANGTVNFAIRQNNSNRILTSPNVYRDDTWHHVAGTLGDEGMQLYVDGQLVASSSTTYLANWFLGYWRVGGDNVANWANAPANGYFNGDLDEVAVYRRALTGNEIREHYLASSRAVPTPTDAYGLAVYNAQPEHFWRLGEASGTIAADASGNSATGTYTNNPTLGGPSAIALTGDASVSFDGTDDYVAGPNVPSAAQVPPTSYSTQLWFRTTSTTGGRLVGFGNSRAAASTYADRHVYMGTDGRLRFGVQPFGNSVVIQSPRAYNDGQWHQVVATQSTAGMALYVDSQLVASDPQQQARQFSTGTTPLTGFWRVGGDTLTGWTGAGSDYFNGSIDEVAVYNRALTADEVTAAFLAGGGVIPNDPPVAAWTSSATGLAVNFNSSGSTDPDGTITGYAWDFGDDTSSALANPSHTYAVGGTYNVSLTVTDDGGGTNTLTKSVSVVRPNDPPVANWTATVNSLTATFSSAGSNDPDGTIASYAWNFGDNTSSTQANPVHAYATAGSYNVSLTVTDNSGTPNTSTKSVTVFNPPPAGFLAQDNFARTVTNGWGAAPTPQGSTWTVNGTTSLYQVNNGTGLLRMQAAGNGPRATLTGVSAGNSDVTVKVTLDKLANGGGSFVSLGSRASGANSYRVKVKTDASGRVTLYLVRADPGETTLTQVLLPSATLTYAAGEQLVLRLQTEGTSPTTLRAKVWKASGTEPTAWQLTTTDSTTALQSPGGFTAVAYLSGSATNAPVEARFDDLAATVIGGGPPPPNQAPVAAWTSSVNGLTATFNSAGSSDPDGTIASYAWNFGDNTTSNQANPVKTYAAAGTYNVTLTVTDNSGAPGTLAGQVTVTVTPSGQLAQDDFGRTVVNGWGSAATGGAWTLNGNANLFQVNNGSGVIRMASAGAGPRATLAGVSATNSDVTVEVSLDKLANGGGAFVSLGSRASGLNSYRAKLKVDATGRVTLYIVRVDPTETTLAQVLLPATTTYAVGEQLIIRLQTQGTSPTTLRAKAWEVGTTEPAAWQLTTTDSSAALQTGGGFTLVTYLTGSATNAPVEARFDDLLATVIA